MKHLILGAGPLGTSLAETLLDDDPDVQLLSVMGNSAYDMPGTRPLAIDGADVDQVREACRGVDVVYVCLNAHYVDWYRLLPPRLEAAIEAAASVGARLIYHDNVYVYGDVAQPLTEATPYRAKTRKGRLRADMAKTLLDANDSGKVQAVIGRSADMYGPGALNSSFDSTLGERHFYPLLAGKTVSIVGNVDQPHTYAFVDDVAQGLKTLAADDNGFGQVWHLPAAPTLSHRELMRIAFEEAGHKPRVRGSKISGHVFRMLGLFLKDLNEVAELLYLFEKPLVVSHQKFEQAYGAHPTPHDEALRKTLNWYRLTAE